MDVLEKKKKEKEKMPRIWMLAFIHLIYVLCNI